MLLHFPSLDNLSTVIAAGQFCLRTIICYMIIHCAEHEALTAVKQASDLAEQTFLMYMAGEIFPEDLSAALRVIRALN